MRHACSNCDCDPNAGIDAYSEPYTDRGTDPGTPAPPDTHTSTDSFTVTYPSPFTTFTYTYRDPDSDTSD